MLFEAFKRVLLTGVVCLTAAVHTGRADGWRQADVDALVGNVIAASGRLTSLSAKVIRTVVTGADTVRITGTVAYLAPDSLRLAYLAPEKTDILITADRFVSYAPGAGQAVALARDSLDVLERELVKQYAFVKIDHLGQMREGYGFAHFNTRDDGLVLSAVPRTGWKNLSRILVKVDPELLDYKALELFDAEGTLTYQARYFDYAAMNGVRFPRRIEIRMVNGMTMVTEVIRLSRLKLNVPVDRSAFRLELPPDVRVRRSLEGD